MQIKLIDFHSNDYQKELALRNQVLREPLGLSLSAQDVEGEENHIHIGAFEQDKLIGCLILTPRDNQIMQMRQVAVAPDAREGGVGRQLIEFAESYAKEQGIKQMTLHARKFVSGFYIKLGYEVEGQEYKSLGIPHLNMQKEL